LGTLVLDDNVLFISKETHEALSRSVIRHGDVLLSIAGTIGKSCVVSMGFEEANCNQAVCVIRPEKSKLNSRYLNLWLSSKDALDQLSFGKVTGVITNLSLTNVRNLQIPLPPLAEQKRIAAILDKADELRTKRRESLAQLDQLIQSTFLEMFGDPVTNPKGWEIRALADVVKQGTIVTYGIVQAGEEFLGGVPYIRTGDIIDSEIKIEGLRHTDPAIAAKFKRSRVDSGDIVMSIRATVGTVAFVPVELDGANLTQGTARISPSANTKGSYLICYFKSAGCQSWIQRQIKGATFREITLKRLREMPVLVPPIELQNRFDSIFQSIEQQKARIQTHLTELDTLFASLQSRAFNGEL
jgi:type I restriction enzyme S subunit